jgi:transcriptional repressor NrdR
MKCPYCGENDNRVVDSRLSKDGLAIRRRRECNDCSRRFTTYEKVEEILPMVVKRDGRREPFSRDKILRGIHMACQKRPVSADLIREFVDSLESYFQELGRREIPSQEIGERVIAKLKDWDEVAYVRFASVYRKFQDVTDFMNEVTDLLKSRKLESGGD